jgi:hypothetical protein
MDAKTLERMIAIREDASGMFFATCEDEPTFFVAQTSRASLDKVIPLAIQQVVLATRHRDMTVVEREEMDGGRMRVRLWEREAVERLAQRV